MQRKVAGCISIIAAGGWVIGWCAGVGKQLPSVHGPEASGGRRAELRRAAGLQTAAFLGFFQATGVRNSRARNVSGWPIVNVEEGVPGSVSVGFERENGRGGRRSALNKRLWLTGFFQCQVDNRFRFQK